MSDKATSRLSAKLQLCVYYSLASRWDHTTTIDSWWNMRQITDRRWGLWVQLNKNIQSLSTWRWHTGSWLVAGGLLLFSIWWVFMKAAQTKQRWKNHQRNEEGIGWDAICLLCGEYLYITCGENERNCRDLWVVSGRAGRCVGNETTVRLKLKQQRLSFTVVITQWQSSSLLYV